MKRKKVPHVNFLRQYRNLMRYSQDDVAVILGKKNHAIISKWEKGMILPGLINIFKLSILYRTPPENLFPELSIALKEEVSAEERKYKSLKNKKKIDI